MEEILLEDPVNLSGHAGDSAIPKIAKSGSNLYVVWADFSNSEVFFKEVQIAELHSEVL